MAVNPLIETVRELSEGLHDGDIELDDLYPELLAAKEHFELAESRFTRNQIQSAEAHGWY